jgi:hypothetical protein
MKNMMKVLASTLSWLLFVAGLAGVAASHVLFDGTREQLVSYGSTAVALLGGMFVARGEPVKSWLRAKPVQWFLFLVNLAAAAGASFLLHGTQGIMAAAGLGVVSLGAAAGLLTGSRGAPAHR